jgi:hypothetical protein
MRSTPSCGVGFRDKGLKEPIWTLVTGWTSHLFHENPECIDVNAICFFERPFFELR